jgi:phage tail-like protein
MPSSDGPRVKLNRFAVELGNVKIDSFKTLSGLDFQIEVLNGLGNDAKGMSLQYARPARVTHPRALTFTTQVLDPKVWSWHQEAWEGKSESMKDGSVVIYDAEYKETARFNFLGGWPSAIQLGGLMAGSNAPMEITVTLQVQDLFLA